MRWIISTGKDIVVDNSQLEARRNYIRNVTKVEVTAWKVMQIKGYNSKKFLYCTSNDGINGTFITAHIGEVEMICSLREVANGDFVIANSCIWEKSLDKNILIDMMRFNRGVELWFAKQEVSVESGCMLRQCTTLSNLGKFGFHTSLSERQLFSKRHNGFMTAVREAFVKVSPISLLGD